jgi:hypothetical protein
MALFGLAGSFREGLLLKVERTLRGSRRSSDSDPMLTSVDSHRTPYGIGSAGLPRIQCRKQRPDRLVPRRRTSHPPSNKIDAPQKLAGRLLG